MIDSIETKVGFTPASFLNSTKVHYQLSAVELVKSTLEKGLGKLNSTGALMVNTGKFTGRSPKDKYIVKDAETETNVCWNDFNNPISELYFELIYNRMLLEIDGKELWVRDAEACADLNYKLKVRVITDTPWASLFVYNMFLRPASNSLLQFEPDWMVYHIASFKGNPEIEGLRSENFSIINFTKKVILIGGTGYTGEIKKGMFTVLNRNLPLEHKVLPMHCSANIGIHRDTALFFGLSGTGKTTLSADADRFLIGDDEHGWSDDGIFNFEGGCYAKCQGLSAEKEPQIFNAIQPGALLENVVCHTNSSDVDFNDTSITENTRVSYPIHFIQNAVFPSLGKTPSNIFFLTCDASGVLPPVAKLSTDQAIYHFLSGYTAKIAGTELGITEPVSTFSTCFGAPFLPLPAMEYASLLEQRINSSKAKVWLINTGWTGGEFGTGSRISLKYTRAIISAVLNNQLDEVEYKEHEVFHISFPLHCPNVPSELLNPALSWQNQSEYLLKAKVLAKKFIANFSKFSSDVVERFAQGGPQ